MSFSLEDLFAELKDKKCCIEGFGNPATGHGTPGYLCGWHFTLAWDEEDNGPVVPSCCRQKMSCTTSPNPNSGAYYQCDACGRTEPITSYL